MKVIVLLFFTFLTLSYADFTSEILEEHNSIRKTLGITELIWSSEIAAVAQNWSDYLATNNLFKHSGTKGVGENIARGTARTYNSSRLFNLWAAEVQYFIPGLNYPDCSTTGKGGSVGHYTQIVWGRTSQLGCGFSVGPTDASSPKAVLVCQYKTPGNYINSPVYTVTTVPTVPEETEQEEETSVPEEQEEEEASATEEPEQEEAAASEESEEEEETSDVEVTTPVEEEIPTTAFAGLSLSDFKGTPNTTSSFGSYTKWTVSYIFNTKTSGSNVRVTMTAKCKLDKTNSWIKSDYTGRDTLRHETGHYYIGSLFAMNFAKQADATTFAKVTYKTDVAQLYNDMLQTYLAMEAQYDLETDSGNNEAMQTEWDIDLINQINDLEDYWW